MELRFDGSQEHQIAAIDATVGILEGQPFVLSRLTIPPGAHFQVVANRMDLDDDTLLANVRGVQAGGGLPESAAFETIAAKIETSHGPTDVSFPNFSIEMETGTGKTYVYLRTALEMCERYGLRKFIIVVPSITVREGVMQTLRNTKKHLSDRYGPYRFSMYDSSSLSRLRNFALSDGLEFMVMTIDSFTTSSNVIRQSKEGQAPPIHELQATRPVLILDEPQNMETPTRKEALALLHPLFALRYSATHKNSYTLIHRLTPYDAYRRGLVKRIEIASVVESDNANLPFIQVDEIVARKQTLTAAVIVHKRLANGSVKETPVKLRLGDDLAIKTGRPEYEGFVVDEINFGAGFLRFENGVEVQRGASVGTEKAAILEAMIYATIEEHFRKQRRLRPLGLKVLSLFFIDKVDNYAPEDGTLRLKPPLIFKSHRTFR